MLLEYFCDKKMNNFESIKNALKICDWNVNDPLPHNSRMIFGIACIDEHMSMISYLIKLGTNVNESDLRSGDYPIGLAADNGNLELVKLLIENGAKLNAKGYWI